LNYENCNYSFISFVLISRLDAQTKNKNENATLAKRYSRVITFSQMDQRKIYHWANGQRSTAAGRNAGGHLPDYVKLVGDDSAVVVKGPKGIPWNN
jgi:hypothetical protein